MPFCQDIELEIEMDLDDASQPPLDTLTFNLVISGGVIDGQNSTMITSDRSEKSLVSGSCHSIANPDVSVMDMVFMWNKVRVVLVGFLFLKASTGKAQFRGRFRAFASVSLAARKKGTKKKAASTLLGGPGEGDTGTGTGQQT